MYNKVLPDTVHFMVPMAQSDNQNLQYVCTKWKSKDMADD